MHLSLFPATLPGRQLRPNRRIGLGFWLGLSLAALILALAFATAAVLGTIARREVVRVTAQNLENISRQMAREISLGMTRFGREIEAEALLPALRDPSTTARELRPIVDHFAALHPEFSYVGVLDAATGNAIAANQGILQGFSAAGRPVFENGRKRLYLGDVHPAVRLAELIPKPASGDALRFLDVSAPVRDMHGNVIRVLGGHVSVEWTRELREQVLSPVRDLRGVETLLVDSAGKVVLAPAATIKVGQALADLAPAGVPGMPRILRWSDGAAYLTVASPVLPNGAFDGFGWRVISRQPEAQALASVMALRSSFVFGAALLGGIAALLAWAIAMRLTRPLRELAESAGRLESMSSAMGAPNQASGEVARVRQALTHMDEDRQRQSAEIQERTRRFAAFADSIPHLVFEADASGAFEYVNQQWEAQIGPATGMSLSRLVEKMPGDDRAALLAPWEQARAQGVELNVLARLMLAGASGPQWFRVRAQPLRDATGAPVRWMGTLTNVNDSVMAAENAGLALAREKAARGELERISSMKDDFLATLSHELRTPINVVGGWAQMLGMKATNPEYVLRAAGVIKRNIDLQAELIDGLLDMSAVAAGKVPLDIVALDAGQLVAGCRESFHKLADDKGVALDVSLPDRPLIMLGDRRRMTQVLSNLVSNAIKFTDRGGRVDIRATEAGGMLTIEVRDTGCGIDPVFLPHVFERFRQQDSSMSRKRGGVGLGLSIAKTLVDLQGGTLSARSAGAGQGSVFALAFQSENEPSGNPPSFPLAAPGDSLATSLRNARILLIEDDPDAREVTRDALMTLGARVESAADGMTALQMLEKTSFDVLVCDIGMPGMDGYALLRQVRSRQGHAMAATPAIALTAFAMRHDRLRSEAAGFRAHVSKPFSLIQLGAAIERVIAAADGTATGPVRAAPPSPTESA